MGSQNASHRASLPARRSRRHSMPSRALNARKITASLDLLGESVTHEGRGARGGAGISRRCSTASTSRSSMRTCRSSSPRWGSISMRSSASRSCTTILARAREYETFVRLDMEGSAYTERTLRLFEDRLYPNYRENVGIVLQSYLYRTSADVRARDPAQVPRAPVQGRVQGARVASRIRRRRMSTRTTCAAWRS